MTHLLFLHRKFKVHWLSALLWVGFLQVVHAQELGWARRLGGNSNDIGYSIATDEAGNVYTTGYFRNTADFDPGPARTELVSAGSDDIFVCKLDASGQLVWARQLGGAQEDRGYAIAVDGDGNVFITGYFQGTADFDPGSGSTVLTSPVDYSLFICKLDATGTFVWARSLGGLGAGIDLAVDPAGNAYVTGYFRGTVAFNFGGRSTELTSAGADDIFVSKLDASGTLVWARSMGGTGNDRGLGIATDGSGNAYTIGYFRGTANFDFDGRSTELTSAGSDDIFVSKLDASGTLAWARRMGGTNEDTGLKIAVDALGNSYATGYFLGTAHFSESVGTQPLVSAGAEDIFVCKLDNTGNSVWAWRMGGTNADRAYSIAVDGSGNAYTTGEFRGTADFDPGVGTSELTAAGSYDCFVSKLDAAGNAVWARRLGGTSDDTGLGIAVDSQGNVYTTGEFRGTADFDPGAGTAELTSEGIFYDIFVSKLSAAPPAGFAIAAISNLRCTLTHPPSDQYSVTFTPEYKGTDGSAITFRVVNEMLPTRDPGPYTLTLYGDNPVVLVEAQQTTGVASQYRFAWRETCPAGESTPRPPTTNGIPNQTLALNQPYQLELAGYFTDPEGHPLSYTASGLPPGLALSGSLITGVPTVAGTSTISVTVRDAGNLTSTTEFSLVVTGASPSESDFSIVDVNLIECQPLSPYLQKITIIPVYAGSDGSSIRFRIVNETLPTEAPGPYSVNLYIDNPTIRLGATQAGGPEVFYTYPWLERCESSRARQGVPEAAESKGVDAASPVAYPNPVRSKLTVKVVSAKSGVTQFKVLDVLGRVSLAQSTFLEAGINKVEFQLESLPAGMYLIQYTDTQGQQKGIRIMKE